MKGSKPAAKALAGRIIQKEECEGNDKGTGLRNTLTGWRPVSLAGVMGSS